MLILKTLFFEDMNDTIRIYMFGSQETVLETVLLMISCLDIYMQVAFYKVPQYGFTIVIIWYFQSQKYLNHKILYQGQISQVHFYNFFYTFSKVHNQFMIGSRR